MSLKKSYGRDTSVSWLKPTDGVEISCSYLDVRNPEYVAVISRITKPVRKLIEQNLLKPDQDRKYAIMAFVEHCVKDWRTVDVTGVFRSEIETDDDVWLPFTPENAIKVFTDYPKLFTDTTDLAQELANYRVTEEALKNSPTV